MRNLTLRIQAKKVLPVLCIVDILLFPYIRFLSCSLSMLLLLAWYSLNIPYVMKRKALIGVAFVVIASMMVGFLCHGKLLGLSAGIIFIFSFMLYFFYWKKFRQLEGLINTFATLMEWFLLIACVFVGIYMVSPELYFTLRSFWTMSGAEIEYSERTINRFTFLFSDPNNAGCMFVSIMAYLLLFGRQTGKSKVLYTAAGSLCSIATFSVTAVGMLLGVYCLLIVPKVKDRKWIRYALLFMAGMLVFMVFAVGMGWTNSLLSNEMVRGLLWRIETNSESGSSLGGRTDLWKNAIENTLNWYNILIGQGAVVDANGIHYAPHSGHLFMLISFGMGANLLFYSKLCYLGRGIKWVNYIPLLPCFAIFTINTGLTDYRFMALYSCLFAAVYVSCRKPTRKGVVSHSNVK